MTQTAAKAQSEIVIEHDLPQTFDHPQDARVARERLVANLRLIWSRRRLLFRVVVAGLIGSILIAFLIPTRYESTTRLMPPDTRSGSSMARLAALADPTGNGILGLLGESMGVRNTGVLFVGILQSRTVQDDLINKFNLRHVYSDRRWEDARMDLAENTEISEDRKSGIITIRVTDRNPARAAAMAAEYAEQLDRVVNRLSTSSAHRERVFLEERLKAVQLDLEDAEKQFSQFASKNTAIDIKEQSKAMVEAAATLQGHLIAAESELEGLKQMYTDNNVRVRSVQARISELKAQLEKIGGRGESTSSTSGTEDDSMFPSIRKLPLLGVTYADLYRRTKVQEAVFESLTKEYELAKVQEAKETPSVKVLDPADVPERKSFPPRLLITFLGICMSLAGGIAWVLGHATWQEVDPLDPGKIFARELLQTARAKMQPTSTNGSGRHGVVGGVLNHFRRGGRPSPEN